MNKGGGKTFVNENIFGHKNIYKMFKPTGKYGGLSKRTFALYYLTKYLTKMKGGQYFKKTVV